MRSMWWLWCVVLVGCVQSSSVQCPDGVVCPSGTLCSASGCVRTEEIEACQGKEDEASCDTPVVADGRCFGGSCVPAGCGNGFVETANGEVCDDGNQIPGDGCAADCRSDETCGNGIVDRANDETCDDGNTAEDDQCRTTCVVPTCGDGKRDIQYNEGCDDGALSDAPDASCRTNCQPRRCGDGIKDVAAGEVCDQGNLIPGDGCTPDCLSDETCGNGYADFAIGETCDDANDLEGDGCTHTCATEEFLFHRLALTPPPTRALHAMAYDVDRGRVVMFGGKDQTSKLHNDTWEWNGTTWVELTIVGSPSTRYGHAMTYDRARKRIVLFGGNAGSGKLADTWEWDGRSWLEVTPTTASPPARDGHALAYDAGRGKVVMFGSGTGDGEVWEWSGAAWTRIAPGAGPTQRIGHAMAYDPKRGRVVMFGGVENLTDRKNDTWEWNGATWADVTPVSNPVPPLADMALVHDAAHDRLVLVGGSGFSDPGQSWAWNGSAWSPLAIGPATSQAGAAYDIERRQIVQFGGEGACGVEPETWILDDTTWTLRERSPSQRRGHAMAYDDRARAVLMFGGGPESVINELAVTNELWSYDGAAWSTLTSTTAPPPARTRHGMAYDGARQQMVVFGGVDNTGAALGDTWVWDGTAWTNATPVTPGPDPRARVGMAYDNVRQRIVLFGGTDGTTRFGDTWEWTGSAWEQITPATTSPSPRAGHGMAFDFYRQRVLLVAGANVEVTNQLVRYNDVWEWDGVDWVDRTPTSGPAPNPREDLQLVKLGGDRSLLMGGFSEFGLENQPWEWTGTSWSAPVLPPGTDSPYQRSQHAMAYDTARTRAVMFGGFSAQTYCLDRRDTWEWTGAAWSRAVPRLQIAPAQRKFSALAYDSVRAVAVLFGGAGLGKSQPARFRDTWEWNGKHWTEVITASPPPARTATGLAYDAVRKVVVLFSGDTGSAARDTWTWNGTTWSDVSPAPSASPPARANHMMTFDLGRGVVVLFGGVASNTPLADTWEWNGTAWTDKTPSGTSPPARREANLVYDHARRRVVLFGGSGSAGRLNDVWEWDGTTWSLVTLTGTEPLARQAAAAWFDPARRSLFVLGGFDGSYRDDLWEVARTPTSTWRRIDPESRPSARSTAVAVYDASRREAVIFGGLGITGFDDTSSGRYEEAPVERCEVARDGDGDGKGGCADPDCWGICDPLCPPGATLCAASRPRCGDAVCNAALESCRSCPGDCGTCTVACGDGWCDAGETAAACPGDCP